MIGKAGNEDIHYDHLIPNVIDQIRKLVVSCLSKSTPPDVFHELMKTSLLNVDESLPPLYLKILTYVEENYFQVSGVADICDHFEISTSYLKKLFQQHHPVSCSQLLLKKKMNLAQVLLISTNKSILEIAKALKFSSSGAFSRSYKNYFGKGSPGGQKENMIIDQEVFFDVAV